MARRATPNQTTPWILGALLHIPGDTETVVALDSAASFAWLQGAKSFYVQHALGNFACRKEARARGGLYWTATRRHNGTIARVHVGRDETVIHVAPAGQRSETPCGKTTIDPPQIAAVRIDDTMLWLDLADGRVLGAPLAWFPRLEGATPEQHHTFCIANRNTEVHWPGVDEDVSVRVLLNLPSY